MLEDKIDAMFPLYENPASSMYEMKQQFRVVARDLLEKQEQAESQPAKRSFAEALTLLETACMYAVKALHQG